MANPIQFLREVKAELTKVVWPDRQTIIRITLAVIAMSLGMAIFLGGVDYGLSEFFDYILKRIS